MNEVLLTTLLAALIAQSAKFFIKANKVKFSWRGLLAYSGMPSGHAAMTTALAASTGLTAGFDSPLFGMACALALLTMRDAIGLRRQLGKQGRIINELVEDLDEDKMLDDNYPHLLEKIGHTPRQIFAGVILGLVVSLLMHWLINFA